MFTSIDWLKGEITGKSHISRENLWFPVDAMLAISTNPLKLHAMDGWCLVYRLTYGDFEKKQGFQPLILGMILNRHGTMELWTLSQWVAMKYGIFL